MKPPRFSIRDILWLTALMAMGVGWYVDRGRVQQQVDQRILEVNAEHRRFVDAWSEEFTSMTQLRERYLKAIGKSEEDLDSSFRLGVPPLNEMWPEIRRSDMK